MKCPISPWSFLELAAFIWTAIFIKDVSQPLELPYDTVNMPKLCDQHSIWWTCVSLRLALSVLSNRTRHWPTLHTQRCNHIWPDRELVCTDIESLLSPITSIICLSGIPDKAKELSAVGFISPVWESVFFIPVLSWLYPTHILKYSGFHHSQTIWWGLYMLFQTLKTLYAKNQLFRSPTYHTNRAVSIRSLWWQPYQVKPTADGFISLTIVSKGVLGCNWLPLQAQSISLGVILFTI